jgi:hypothetical protein
LAPVDDLTVGVVSILSTERRPSNLALEHDCTQAPPITILTVTMTTKDFRSNVVRSTNRGISHDSTRLSPIIDDASIAYSEVDLVQIDRIAVGRSSRLSLKELLVIGTVMQLMKASRQTEIRELDMSTTIKQNIIRFDIAMQN